MEWFRVTSEKRPETDCRFCQHDDELTGLVSVANRATNSAIINVPKNVQTKGLIMWDFRFSRRRV
jgi:hypothetical protein